MQTRTLIHARDPIWVNKEKTALNLIVVFAELNGEMPFTATSYDDLAYGREIFQRAFNGEFGVIRDYIEPSVEQLSNDLRYQRDMLLKDCDWTQFSDVSIPTKDQWAIYRQQLRDITLQENFPYSVQWPIPPA